MTPSDQMSCDAWIASCRSSSKASTASGEAYVRALYCETLFLRPTCVSLPVRHQDNEAAYGRMFLCVRCMDVCYSVD